MRKVISTQFVEQKSSSISTSSFQRDSTITVEPQYADDQTECEEHITTTNQVNCTAAAETTISLLNSQLSYVGRDRKYNPTDEEAKEFKQILFIR